MVNECIEFVIDQVSLVWWHDAIELIAVCGPGIVVLFCSVKLRLLMKDLKVCSVKCNGSTMQCRGKLLLFLSYNNKLNL
jgi:hypothetical protein